MNLIAGTKKLKKSYFFIGILLFNFFWSQSLKAQLKADFTASPTSGCGPLTVSFTDKSTGSPVSWQWKMGNGNNNVFKQNPSAIYINSGSYTVTLIVKDASGNV